MGWIYIILYVLGASFLILFVVSVIQFYRILKHEFAQQKNIKSKSTSKQMSNVVYTNSPNAQNRKNKKWSGKLLFHAVISLFLLVRGSFFCFEPSYLESTINLPASIQMIWEQIGNLMFVLAYFLLLLYWYPVGSFVIYNYRAQFYYQAEGSNKPDRVADMMQLPKLISFILVGLSLLALFTLALVWIHNDDMAEKMDVLTGAVLSFVAFLVAILFLYYGIKISFLMKKQQILLQQRKKAQFTKLVSVAIICTISFLARSAIVLASTYYAYKHFTKDFNSPWAVVITFFVFTEMIPIVMMLFLLRKVPSKGHNTAKHADPINAPLLA